MNKIYKTVWNAARRCLVVVSEATKSALQKSGSSREKGCEVGQLRASQTFGFKHSKFAFDDFGVSRLVIAMIAAFSIIGTASAAPSWEGDLDRDYRQNIADGLIIDDGEWGLAHEGNYALSYAGSVTIEQGSAFGSMIRDGVNVWLNKSSNIFYNHGGLYLSAWKDGGTYYFSNGAGIQNYAGANLVFGYLNGTSWADGVQFNEGSFLQNSGSTWNQSIFLLDGGTITNNGSWINETDSFTMNSGTFTGSGNFQNLAQASVNGGTFRTGTLTLVAGNFNSGSTLVVGNQSGNLSTATLNLNGGALGTKISQTGGNVNVNGTYTLSNFNKTGGTLTNNQTLTLSGANIGASGSFVNNKTLKLTGNNTISGTITGSGTVSISGTANVAGISGAASVAVTSGTASIQSVNTAKIDNAGALTITNFAKDSDVTYTQTGGSLTANTDWLTNSIFNIRGGSLTRDVLGENTFNVAGGTVSTDTLTSDTTLNLSSGTFKTNHLALTEGQTAKVSGGTFQTAIEEMFTGLEGSTEDALKTIGLSASVPEEIKTTLTSWFQKYAPGTVIEGLADHITMTGGKVVVTGVNLTTTMRDDLTKAFKETFFKHQKRTLSNACSLLNGHRKAF